MLFLRERMNTTKKRWLLVSFGLVLGVYGEPEGPVFDYLQTIESEILRGEVYQFDLPEAVFDGAHAFPQDFRIMDSTGFSWPYVIHTPREESSLATLSARMLRHETVGGEQPYVELEVQLFPNQLAGGRMEHNVLTIRSSGGHYRREVEIFSKSPSGELAALGDGYLVHFGPAANAVLRRLRYDESTASILVVRVHPEVGSPLDFKVSQLSVGHQRFRSGEISGVPMTCEQEMVAGASGWSEAGYDSGFISRPIDTLRFDFGPRALIRAARISGRNDASNSWQLVSEPVLQATERFPLVDITLQRCTFRWLKIELYHGGETPVVPLHVQAFATPRRIIFEAMTEGPGLLRYGTEDVLAPVPGATRRMNQADLRTVPVVELGERRALASLQKTSKALKKMFYFSLAGVVGLIALILFVRRAF
ncbi:MAG: hypothetical protein ACI9TH_000968 [Kiritimatiellia bacterium]|jgi:hypothetical protein